MHPLFKAVNAVCDKLQVVSDLFWDFPTNFDWYANIPILGNFSLAIILLIGSGIFFTCQLRFIQVRKFKYGLHVLKTQKAQDGHLPPGLLPALYCDAGRSGQHPGRHRRHQHRRPRRALLDVVLRLLRHGHRLHRIHPVPDLQGEKGR